MLNLKKLTLVSILLLIVCLTVLFSFLQTGEQTEYSIEVRGYAWDHSSIKVCIIPQQNMSWWKPEYLNAVLNGIAQWNDAIQEFAQSNTNFSYLLSLRFVPSTNYENVSGFDTYIGWVMECESDATIGKTWTSIKFPCYVTNATVCLTTKAPSGHIMTEVDMQNIVVHELGHTFGLSHCNISSDVMYPNVYYQETVKPLSTLDLYGVAQIFELKRNSTCPEESVVTMPSSISYSHFQISPENTPASVPKNLIEITFRILMRPEIIILVGVLSIAAVLIVIEKRERKNRNVKAKQFNFVIAILNFSI